MEAKAKQNGRLGSEIEEITPPHTKKRMKTIEGGIT